MGELKPGWRRVKFGQLAECVNDRVDDPSQAGVDRYVGLEHLDPESLTIRRWGTPDQVESTKLRFRPGDIIFGKRRAYQRKLAVADCEGICSAHAMVLRARPGAILPEFLPFFMQSDTFMERAQAISVGSLSPTINWKTLSAEEFALPPLEKQRRLASAMAVAQHAVETAFEALRYGEQARTALLAGLYRNGTRGESLRTTEIGTLPISWGVEPLGARFEVQLGKMMSEKARAGDGHIPYLRNANVQWNRLDLDDVATMAFTPAEREKFSLRYGDILACEGRHVGKSAMWRDEIPGACYQKALHRLRPLGSDVPEYLLHCLAYYSMTGRFVAETGETTIPHLPAERFRAMLFPFPSREEQLEIADAVNSMDAALESIRRRREGSLHMCRTILEMSGVA